MQAIAVDNLTKRYGDREVLKGISFTVARGEVFALLGPNGAGKSTTVEILEGYRAPSSGTVSVLGVDPQVGGHVFHERVGLVLQSTSLDDELTVREIVEFYGSFYTHPQSVNDVLTLVGLVDQKHDRIKILSGGQRRRVDLALGIIGDPELLFLDEPTTGLDPVARRQAWDIVRGLCSLGKTVLLTTHYLDEAQQLADRVAVLVDGRIVAEGDPATLGGRDAGLPTIRFRLPSGVSIADVPTDLSIQVGADGRTVALQAHEPTRALAELIAWCGGAELEGLTVSRPTLEDVYLSLTAKGGYRD